MRIRQEQKEEIRAALLKAGTDLISSRGFAATTVDAITAAAGVAKGTRERPAGGVSRHAVTHSGALASAVVMEVGGCLSHGRL